MTHSDGSYSARVVSLCCDAPTRAGQTLGPYGPAPGTFCTSCGAWCATHRIWDGLPPVGSFSDTYAGHPED